MSRSSRLKFASNFRNFHYPSFQHILSLSHGHFDCFPLSFARSNITKLFDYPSKRQNSTFKLCTDLMFARGVERMKTNHFAHQPTAFDSLCMPYNRPYSEMSKWGACQI
uniref:(northern house mosquito) hypothetical protein n=1 Tax=Culex pipiens TaxID=7175 RepID=A0A8D8F922_CULPI